MPTEPEPLMSYDEWMESPARMLFLRPSMYVGKAGIFLVEAFLRGFDTAREGAVLDGFHQWLDMRLGYLSACGPTVRLVGIQCPEWSITDPVPSEFDETIRNQWLQLLDEFIAERTERGLPDILERYRLWREARV